MFVVYWLCGIGVVLFFSSFYRFYSFATLGFSVTTKIRKLLYSKILEKNMGWFDDREHATSVLTTTMSEKT